MANQMPSLLALLGLAAFAGYQNRDKIGAAIRDAQTRRDAAQPQSGLDGALAGIGDLLGNLGKAGSGGNVLTDGLGDLMDRFKQSGQGETADSWVNPAVPTRGLTPAEVERAIGTENLRELTTRTGLTREELLQRLSTAIPETVDSLTPNGHMPTEDDARRHFSLG